MSKPLRIGIAGLGTVGAGALKILTQHAPLIAERAGRPLTVAAIAARNPKKDRGLDVSLLRWVNDPLMLAGDDEIDVVVEAIGGAEGVARELVEKALANGKSVVTANKALIAGHGVALAKLAEKSGAVLAFEAAVAGGIPIIKSLRDGLSANRILRIAGILNGTCNYILTHMAEEKRGFADVLAEAQDKGYAEAEPEFDVGGIDAAQKLAILTSLAYGIAPAVDQVYVEGIRRIDARDMTFAAELGYTIKLLGIATLTEHGILQRVHPCMLEKSSALARVSGVYNAVLVEGDAVGSVLFEGRGAGGGPTASSVVADIMDIARGVRYKPFTWPVAALKDLPFAGMETRSCPYYLRLGVADQPGVLAEVADIFKREHISLASVLQHSPNPDEIAQVVLVTHDTSEASMQKALQKIGKLTSVKEPPFMIRIEAI